ncbi:Tol-Pal system subunit TolQ [candidate division GN15 bacterium]|nr:Tol-Pal system subunit TolQ [candidate division GN15 bacterium]
MNMTSPALILQSGTLWEIIQNLSTFGAFILIVLLAMSIGSWMIIFRKYRLFRSVETDNQAFMQYFRRSRRLDEVAGQARNYKLSPLANIYLAGFDEMQKIDERKNEAGGLRESKQPLTGEDFELVEMTMERTLNDQVAALEKQVVFLATTGSSAPFMGLLGTVVGIMDSFWAIGERGSASLAVVAPGIAEALLATIVGLAAAIPAVIAYNWANNRMKALQTSAVSFILDFNTRARRETM